MVNAYYLQVIHLLFNVETIQNVTNHIQWHIRSTNATYFHDDITIVFVSSDWKYLLFWYCQAGIKIFLNIKTEEEEKAIYIYVGNMFQVAKHNFPDIFIQDLYWKTMPQLFFRYGQDTKFTNISIRENEKKKSVFRLDQCKILYPFSQI